VKIKIFNDVEVSIFKNVTNKDYAETAFFARLSRYNYMERSKKTDLETVNFLAKKGHYTPLRNLTIGFEFTIPIVTARQIMRTNTGVIWNEMSLRYNKKPLGVFIPKGINEDKIFEIILESYSKSFEVYNKLMDSGLKPEKARCVLPVYTATKLGGIFNFQSLLEFLQKRTKYDVQDITRSTSNKMLELVKDIPPFNLIKKIL
jgi:flavin-dependent thymidylate synthase